MSENENRADELNEALKSMWDSLSDEQKEKAKECKTMDELMLCAGKMGIELPDELLDTVAGGLKWPNSATYTNMTLTCPYCGKSSFQQVRSATYIDDQYTMYYKGKCIPCDVYFWQADNGRTYDQNMVKFLGEFKRGC